MAGSGRESREYIRDTRGHTTGPARYFTSQVTGTLYMVIDPLLSFTIAVKSQTIKAIKIDITIVNFLLEKIPSKLNFSILFTPFRIKYFLF